MTAKNARIVANLALLTAGGALAVLAWRRPSVRRAAMSAVPFVIAGAPPLQIAAFVVGRALADRALERGALPRSSPQGLGYATERGSADRLDLAPTTE